MYNRLYECLTKNNLLFDKQSGIRNSHLTEHALTKLVNRIYDYIMKVNVHYGYL